MESKKVHTKVFFGFLSGPDSDYGPVRNETVKVTIEQSWPFDADQIAEMKEALNDHFDCTIRTEEELAEEEKYWQEEANKLK